MSDICAIVLDYFGLDKTEKCLRSLVGQGIGEVRVVDNSADPAYQAILSQRMHLLGDQVDFALFYSANDRNLGFGKAINRALKRPGKSACYRFYLLLNNDACAGPEMVASLAHALIQHPQAGMVAASTLMDEQAYCGLWYQRHTGVITMSRLPGSFYYLPGSCLLIKAELVDAGLFDEAFFMYGEDVELGWRLRHRGFAPRCVPEATLLHIGAGSSRRGGLFYEYHVVRGHLLLGRKLATGTVDRLFMELGRAIALPLRATLRCIRYRSFAPWHALVRAWLAIPPIDPVHGRGRSDHCA